MARAKYEAPSVSSDEQSKCIEVDIQYSFEEKSIIIVVNNQITKGGKKVVVGWLIYTKTKGGRWLTRTRTPPLPNQTSDDGDHGVEGTNET